MFFGRSKEPETASVGESIVTQSVEDKSAYQLSREHDEPEVDYDKGATKLYKAIEEKDWDGALVRIEEAPYEAKTWVKRMEADDNDKIRWRLLPIHATCIFRAPLNIIESLIAAYHDGPQMKDDQGMLPVHLACRNGASKGIVVTLLNAFPESVNVKDRKGRLPLDFVESSQSQNREAVIVSLKKFKSVMDNKALPKSGMRIGGMTNQIKGSTKEVDYEHRTMLFRLVLKKEWKGASQRSNSFPDEAATWIVTKGFNGNLRFLPIHKACVLNPPEGLIETLIAAYPDGAKSRDQDGWLPIHCACFYGASGKVVNTLLVASPKGAQCKDDEGRLPIHYACLKNAPDGVVKALVASYPKGCMSKDDDGRLPIHHACSKGAPDGVIESLLKANPKSAQTKDDQGRLPLHHVCRKNASGWVIKTLLKVYPRGAQIKDDQDKLPIHYACQNCVNEDMIKLLLQAHPESVHVKNGFGYTPLDEVKASSNGSKAAQATKILEEFIVEHDKKTGKEPSTPVVSTSKEYESKIEALTSRVEFLEQTIAEIAKIGILMKEQKIKDKSITLLAEKLSSLSVNDKGSENESHNANPTDPVDPAEK